MLGPMTEPKWHHLGDVETLKQQPLREVIVGRTRLAVTWVNGELGVVNGVCNHVGGPLGQGTLEGDYLTCPWHQWKFHRATGKGEPGFEEDAVPAYVTKVEDGQAYVDLSSSTPRSRKPHAPHPLA